MEAVSPVFDDLKELEVVLGQTQDEYSNLPVVVGLGRVTCRMEPSPEEREAIAAGADLIVTILNFQKPIQPLAFLVATKGEIMSNKAIREHLGIFSTASATDQLEKIMKELGGTTSFATLARAEQAIRLCRTLEARCEELTKTYHEMEAIENVVRSKVINIAAYVLKEAARYMEYTSDAEMLGKLAESYLSGDKEIPSDVSKSL